MQVEAKHHKKLPIEAWDYIAANGLGFFEGNIIECITRAAKTGNRNDLLKAQHYLVKLLEITAAPNDDHNFRRSLQRDPLREDIALPHEINATQACETSSVEGLSVFRSQRVA